MAKQQRRSAPPPTTTPAPTVPEVVSSGLEAIRSHGGRDEELYISADGAFFEEAFMTDRIVTAEEHVRFVKKIEALVRGSPEYSAYVGYLRNELRMDRCSFLPGLDMSENEVGLEMHHAPLTLFAIVDIVISHRLARGQAVTSLTVADEVMRAHYEEKVGIVPLSRTAHKLVHSGALTLHPAMIHGGWVDFLRDYPDGVDEVTISKLIEFLAVTEESVVATAGKASGAAVPLLREGASVPTVEQVKMLLLAPVCKKNSH